MSQLTCVDFTEDYEAELARLIWGITGERPRAAKGEQPGAPTRTLEPSGVESLRREVHAAVELFKSRTGEPSLGQQVVQPVTPRTEGEGKNRCFVVMPFGDQDLQVVYEDFVRLSQQPRETSSRRQRLVSK